MQLGTATVIIEAPLKGFENSLKSAEKSMGRFGKTVAGSLAVAGSAFAAFTGMSVREFAKFEGQSQAWGKVGIKNIEAMRKELATMPPIYGKMEQMAAGYYQAVSAGVPAGKQAMDILVQTAKATKAAREEGLLHADVMKGTTKLLAGYRGQIGSTTEALDTLFAIEKAGQTSFGELVPIIGEIASMSYEAGVSVDEMGGALALATQTAGSTAQAVTQINTLFKSFVKPTQQLAEEYEALGYASGKAMVEELGLVGALEKLDTHAKKTGRTVAGLFDDKEAMLAAAALSANGFKDLGEKIDMVADKAGGLESAWGKWQETFEASEERFKNSINRAMVQWGEKTAPMVINAMDWISEALDNLEVNMLTFGHMMDEVGQGGALMWEDLSHAGRTFQADAIEMMNETVGLIKKGFVGMEMSGQIVFGMLITTVRKAFAEIQKIAADMLMIVGKGFQEFGKNDKASGLYRLAGEWRVAANSVDSYGETLSRITSDGLDRMRAVDAETAKNIETGKKLSGVTGDLEKMHRDTTAAILQAGEASEQAFQKEIMSIEAAKAAYSDKGMAAAAVKTEIQATAKEAEKLAKITEADNKEAKKRAEEAKKYAEKLKEIEVQAAQEKIDTIMQTYTQFYADMGVLTETGHQMELGNLEIQKQAYIDAGVARIDVEKWFQREKRRLEEEASEAQRRFQNEMAGLTGSRFEKETREFEDELKKQLDYYRDHEIDKTKIAEYESLRRWEFERQQGEKMYSGIFAAGLESFTGMDSRMVGNVSGMLGQLGGAMEGGIDWAEFKDFLGKNKEGIANVAEYLAMNFRKEQEQTKTQQKLDLFFDKIGDMGWIGSLVNAGWNAGRGMTQRSEGGMVSNGKWVEVGDASTGDFSADPAVAYATQKITGDKNYRTGGQRLAASIKTGDKSEGVKAAGVAVSEWMDPTGAISAKFIKDKVGGSLGNFLSTFVGGAGVMPAFFGGKENYYRFTDMKRDKDVDEYQSGQSWDRGTGFSNKLDTIDINEDTHWYSMIEGSYKKGINAINDNFHEQMQMRMKSLPEEYASVLADQIDAYGDFTIELPEGRFNSKNWSEDVTQLLTKYQDKITQVMDDATVMVINSYIQGGSAVDSKIKQSTKTNLMSQQFQAMDADGKGITTESGDIAFAGDTETAFKRYEIIQAIEQAWAGMNDQFDLALGTSTQFEMRMAELNTTFSDQITTLEQLGFTESAIAEIREKQAQVMAQEQEAFREVVEAQLSAAREMITPMTEVEKAAKDTASKFDAMTEAARQAGASVAELTELETLRSEVLAQQAADFAEQRGAIFSDLAMIGQPVDAVSTVVGAFNGELDAAREKLVSLGASQTDLGRLETERFRIVHDGVLALGDGIRSQFDEIRESIRIEGMGGVGSTGYLSEIESVLSRPNKSFESLEQASGMLIQWYNAASADAQQATNSMSGAMDQSTQAAAAWAAAAKAVEDLVKSIEQTIRGIKYSDLNVGLTRERQQSASQDYEEIKARAMTGDQDAIKEFQSFASTYLKESQERFSSSGQYVEIYDAVLGDLEALKAKAKSGELTDGFVEAATAASLGGSGYAAVGGGQSMDDIQATFERLSTAIEAQLESMADKEAVLNIRWEGLGGDSATAINLISQIFSEYGTDSTATITFMSEFVNNFAGDLPAKMEALGFVAGRTGWDSSATMAFVAAMGASGQGSWEDIKAQMDAAGVGGTITTQLEFAFNYDIGKWQQDVSNLISQGVGYQREIEGFGTVQVTGANQATYTGASGQTFDYNAQSNLQQLATQYSDVAAMAQGYLNQPAIDINSINAKYPAFDLTSRKVAQEMLDKFRYPESMLQDMMGPSYHQWHSDMKKVFKYHGLAAPPYATGGLIDRSLGDDGLISIKTGREGVITEAGISALERINLGGDITGGDSGKVAALLSQILSAIKEKDDPVIEIRPDGSGFDRILDARLIDRGLTDRRYF